MANILFQTPAAWQDQGGANPPTCWDGTEYTIVEGSPQTLTYLIAPGTAGDTISIDATWDGSVTGTPIVFLTSSVGGTLAAINTTGGAGSGQLQYTLTGLEPDLVLNVGFGGENTFGVTLSQMPPVAPDLSMTVAANTTNNQITPTITVGGETVTPSNLLVYAFGLPTHGTAAPASFSDTSTFLSYTPNAGYSGEDSFQYTAYVDGVPSNFGTVTVEVTQSATNYNCACDDTYPTLALSDFRTYLMTRLGYAGMLASPPPGMVQLLNAFISEAQELLFREYPVFRMERWFTWNMAAGVRFYDIAANVDTCTVKLDPRMVTWVGISRGDDVWRMLQCGINPERYSSRPQSVPDSYEIRQCIEVWPAPSDASWNLRIKGYFGLLPFAADTDVSTIDPQAIKLLALANAKAHYGQPDAGNYMQLLKQLIGSYTAGSHDTRRYIPKDRQPLAAVRPVRSS